jgi:hypothetical protein
MAFKGLFVGIDRYDSPEINWLSCANRDARALHALFTDTLGGETMLLTDEQATVAVIESVAGIKRKAESIAIAGVRSGWMAFYQAQKYANRSRWVTGKEPWR